jgi:hypothetical protein
MIAKLLSVTDGNVHTIVKEYVQRQRKSMYRQNGHRLNQLNTNAENDSIYFKIYLYKFK